ncbi:MAG TPA: RNA-binding protein [Firmicutes bacterium]|nr:RNA-binding protein [Bacillota bacterium]
MTTTLYVGNLPWATTEEELRDLFSPHCAVVSTRIITDRETGRSRGFGFVEVEDDDVERVVEATNGMEVGGRQLVVNEARPRPERGRF